MAADERGRHGERRLPQVVVAAALAARLFQQPQVPGCGPVARIRDVMFLLSGQVSAWTRWPELSFEDQQNVGDLLRYRDPDLANETVVRRVLKADLADQPIRLPEDAATAETIELTGPPEVLFIEGLKALKKTSARSKRTVPVADQGAWVAPVFRGRGIARTAASVHYTLPSLPVLDAPAPVDIGEPAASDDLAIPVEELREIARRLDAAADTPDAAEDKSCGFRVESLDKIFKNLQTSAGPVASETWEVTAGPLQVLHAPTGFGKSVLTELVACWCAQHGRVMTILVSTNAAVIKTAYAIDQHLRTLGIEGSAVPLTSPNTAQAEAEKVITSSPEVGGMGQWAMSKMAYGCALVGAANETATQAWTPGQEPCTKLRPAAEERPRPRRCPWLGTCGKFRTTRQAAQAPVVVTSFGNWQRGVVQVPLSVEDRVIDGMRVEELLMRRSDLVLIDEVDEFQSDMIKNSAGQFRLAHEKAARTPIQRIAEELHQHKRQLNGAIRSDAQYATSLTQTLADSYVTHLADGDFHSVQAQGGKRHPLLDRWLLPERWDRDLVEALFGLADQTAPTAEQWNHFYELFPKPGAQPSASFPDWMRPIRAALTSIRTNAGVDPFDEAREGIIAVLGQRPGRHHASHDRAEALSVNRSDGKKGKKKEESSEEARDKTADRLIRRAYLTRLQRLLTQFIYLGPNLVDAGVTSAAEIADNLGTYKAWRAAPFGPLGHTLFAFTENYDPDHPEDTVLAANAIGGDPHEYVRSIGETTALALLRRRRCVVGLSATSYFPGAVHHHVLVEPTWWVSDDLAGGDIELLASPASDADYEKIRISGTSGWERRLALRELGKNLYFKQLRPELENLAADPKTARRARLMLATTSYEGAEDLAWGLRAAGVPASQIVLAVPPSADEQTAPSLNDGSGGNWRALPGGQLEQFGANPEEKFLIAPLARAGRGINIVGADSKSLIGSIWMVVRPIPIIDEPAEILAHAHALAKMTQVPGPDPDQVLEETRRVAGQTFTELFSSLPYFSTLPENVQLGVVAETLVGLIQLAGRGRRGGTTARIHLVDYAFFDTTTKTDLPTLIHELLEKWATSDDGRHLALAQSLYGRTLQTIRDFATEQRAAHATDEEVISADHELH